MGSCPDEALCVQMISSQGNKTFVKSFVYDSLPAASGGCDPDVDDDCVIKTMADKMDFFRNCSQFNCSLVGGVPNVPLPVMAWVGLTSFGVIELVGMVFLFLKLLLVMAKKNMVKQVCCECNKFDFDLIYFVQICQRRLLAGTGLMRVIGLTHEKISPLMQCATATSPKYPNHLTLGRGKDSRQIP